MDNEKKTYTLEIIGQNGSFKVEGLSMNGTNYVSETEVDTKDWPATFKFTAKDEEGNITESHDHAKLLQQVSYEWDSGKWYLAFGEVSEQELLKEQLAAMKEATTNTELALCEVYEMLLGGAE